MTWRTNMIYSEKQFRDKVNELLDAREWDDACSLITYGL